MADEHNQHDDEQSNDQRWKRSNDERNMLVGKATSDVIRVRHVRGRRHKNVDVVVRTDNSNAELYIPENIYRTHSFPLSYF